MKKVQNVVRPYAVRAVDSVAPYEAGVLGYVELLPSKECKHKLTLFTVMREGNLILLMPCPGLHTLYTGDVCSEPWADRVLAKALTVGVSYGSGGKASGCDESVLVRFSAIAESSRSCDPTDSLKSVVAKLNLYFKEAHWP